METSPVEENAHLPVLKRVGLVLVVFGLLDIGAMIYCILNRISYSSSFNIFAVIAGIFLLRGSLKAAQTVLWFATFYLTGFTSVLIFSPYFVAPGLILAMIRLYPTWFGEWMAFVAALLALLYWIVRELRSEPVAMALSQSGLKPRSSRSAYITGFGLVAILVVAETLTLTGAKVGHAKALAALQTGPGYNYQVTSMSSVWNAEGTDVSAVVTAWNSREIRNVPVHWKE
jgi:hypothetical protein